MGIIGGIGRSIRRTSKTISRAAKKIPIAGEGIKASEKFVKGPVARTFEKAIHDPWVQTIGTPVVLPAHLIHGAATGGLKGAARAAKEELKNPVRRWVVRGVGVIFPPAAPAAVALEAANITLNAVESKDPVKAAKAVAQIGAIAAGAELGDSEATRALEFIQKAEKVKQGASSLPIAELAGEWVSDDAAQRILGELHSKFSPAELRAAVNTLHEAASVTGKQAGSFSAEQRARVNKKVDAAAELVAASIEGAAARPDLPFFQLLGPSLARDVERIEAQKGPHAARVVKVLEGKVMSKQFKRVKGINRLLFALNSRDPHERAAAKKKIAPVAAGAKRGDPVAASRLDEVRRRAAGLKAARGYKVDTRGMVRRAAGAR